MNAEVSPGVQLAVGGVSPFGAAHTLTFALLTTSLENARRQSTPDGIALWCTVAPPGTSTTAGPSESNGDWGGGTAGGS